ncbi:unnamed protein product [Orchesella dallaii]|uniref:CCHC-type domain-containing protein n=1 Tax=Orchesella dallaii TaxID=48710 RepID=A0ABP1R435_9HEXA
MKRTIGTRTLTKQNPGAFIHIQLENKHKKEFAVVVQSKKEGTMPQKSTQNSAGTRIDTAKEQNNDLHTSLANLASPPLQGSSAGASSTSISLITTNTTQAGNQTENSNIGPYNEYRPTPSHGERMAWYEERTTFQAQIQEMKLLLESQGREILRLNAVSEQSTHNSAPHEDDRLTHRQHSNRSKDHWDTFIADIRRPWRQDEFEIRTPDYNVPAFKINDTHQITQKHTQNSQVDSVISALKRNTKESGEVFQFRDSSPTQASLLRNQNNHNRPETIDLTKTYLPGGVRRANAQEQINKQYEQSPNSVFSPTYLGRTGSHNPSERAYPTGDFTQSSNFSHSHTAEPKSTREFAGNRGMSTSRIDTLGRWNHTVAPKPIMKHIDPPTFSGRNDNKSAYDFLEELRRYQNATGATCDMMLQLRRELDRRSQGEHERLSDYIVVIIGYYKRLLRYVPDYEVISKVLYGLNPIYFTFSKDLSYINSLQAFLDEAQKIDEYVCRARSYRPPPTRNSIEQSLQYTPFDGSKPATDNSYDYRQNRYRSPSPFPKSDNRTVTFAAKHNTSASENQAKSSEHSTKQNHDNSPGKSNGYDGTFCTNYNRSASPQKVTPTPSPKASSPGPSSILKTTAGSSTTGCWRCGGNHYKKDCPLSSPASGNGKPPGRMGQ